MTVKSVTESLAVIEDLAGYDDEAASSRELELYESVLNRIARGCPNGPQLAAEALKSSLIEFRRGW